MDLIERVKNACIDAYFCPQERKIMPFGTSQAIALKLFFVSPVCDHFSKWDIRLPKEFRDFATKNDTFPKEHRRTLIISHYKLPIKAFDPIRKELLYDESNVKFDKKWTKEEMLRIGKIIDSKQYLKNPLPEEYEKIYQKHKNSTCIYAQFTGSGLGRRDTDLPLLIGPKDLMNEVMNFLKQSPENVFIFYRGLAQGVVKTDLDFIELYTEKITIFDLCKKPTIVKHAFTPKNI